MKGTFLLKGTDENGQERDFILSIDLSIAVPIDQPPVSNYSIWFRANGLVSGENNSYGWVDATNNISKLLNLGVDPIYADQSIGANQPDLIANVIGGKKVVRFLGSPVGMNLNNASGLSQNISGCTIYWVGKVSTGGAQRTLFYLSTNSESSARFIVYSDAATNNWSVAARRLDADSAAIMSGGSSLTNKICAITMDYASGDVFLYENGIQVASSNSFTSNGSTSNTVSGACYLGKNNSGNNFIGDVGDIIFYKSAHGPTQIGQVSSWLNSFYSIY